VTLEARAVEELWRAEDGPIHVRSDDGEELMSTRPDKMTRVAGIYAAADTARLTSSVTLASADGVLAGAAIHQALMADDLERAA
jgi:thioredoxin reductase